MAIVPGTSGNDTLYGGINSAKTLMGFGGDDTYVLYNSKSKVEETAKDSGNDTIQLASTYNSSYSVYSYGFDKYYGMKGYSYTLSASNIEVLDGSQVSSGIKLISNAKTPMTIKGGSGADYLIGGKNADTIIGNDASDILYGGNDSVADTLDGGAGDDAYVIKDFKDRIIDTSGDNSLVLDRSFCFNTVDLNSVYTYANSKIFHLDAFYQKKSMILIGNANEDNYIEGTDRGNDTIYGGNKDDELRGYAGNDKLYGGDGYDYLAGYSGNDTLDGGNDTYQDYLWGGKGNDTYIQYATAETIEEDKNGGIDTIKLSNASVLGTVDLNSYPYVENIDGSDITSTALTLTGSSLINKITGGKGADLLSGGNDLTADTLTGGDGNDTYLVYSSKDKVVEGANTVSDTNTGSDTVALQSTYNLKAYTMANNIETLNATSISKAMTLTGNASSNTIKGTSYADKISGNAGNDILYGNAGNDTLTGGVGDDTFGFAAGDAKDIITSTDKGDIINIQATNVTTSDMLFYTDKKGALYIDYTDDSITGTKLGVGADVISVAKGKWDPSTTVQVGNKEVLIGSIIQAINTSGSGLSNLDATAISALTTTNQTDITLTWNAV